MALIKCPECGKQVSDKANACPNCGYSFLSKKKSNNQAKSILYSALLLNIFSVVVTVIFLFVLEAMDGNFGSDSSSDSSVSVTFESDISTKYVNISVIMGIIIFILGFVIYYASSKVIKMSLSVIYLIMAIVALFIFLIGFCTYILATCGLGSISLIPGILQIIAGAKYISGSKKYVE